MSSVTEKYISKTAFLWCKCVCGKYLHVRQYCTSYHVYHFYYNVLLCTTAHSFMAASPAL